jgi:hypothetical protein
MFTLFILPDWFSLMLPSARKPFSISTCLLRKHIRIVFALNFILLFNSVSNIIFCIFIFLILWVLLYEILPPWWTSVLCIHPHALFFDFILYKDRTLLLNSFWFDERLLKYIFVLVDNTVLFFLQIIISICTLIVNRDAVINAVDAAGNVHVSSALLRRAVVHFVGRFGSS